MNILTTTTCLLGLSLTACENPQSVSPENTIHEQQVVLTTTSLELDTAPA